MIKILRTSGSVPRQPTYGKYPAVAINDHGIVVELHQPSFISTTICCQIGSVNGERIVFCEPNDLDSGKFPNVAINNANRVVEVHEGHLRRFIYYRIGTVEVPAGGNLSCRWQGERSTPFQWGRFPAIAVHDNTAVITYDQCYGIYGTYYHIGTINADGTNINWGERSKLFEEGASNTSVAINADNVVAVGRGWKCIMCFVAGIQRGAGGPHRVPQLGAKKEICFGQFTSYCPNICLTADQDVVLVWQSYTGRHIRRVAGIIVADAENAENRTINFDRKTSRYTSDLDFGYNPSMGVSLNGQVVLENETCVANMRCTLHYRTGVLERDRNNQEPDNAAQGELGLQQRHPPPPQPGRRDGEQEVEEDRV